MRGQKNQKSLEDGDGTLKLSLLILFVGEKKFFFLNKLENPQRGNFFLWEAR
jgi:hypothetical protein